MKLQNATKHAVLVLSIVLALSATCAVFLHESAQAAARSQAASIVIEKAADVTEPAPGQRVTFAITVSIPPKTPYMDIPILITETLPSYAEFGDAGAPYTRAANTLQWARVLSSEIGFEVVTFSIQVASTVTPYFPIVNREYAVLARGEVIHGEPVTLTVTPRYTWVYLPLVLRAYPPIPTITAFNLIPWRGSQEQQFAYSAEVTATLAASVQNDVVQQVCFGVTAQTMTDCRPFDEAVAYTLPSGSGYQAVYAQVKGAHGGVSAPVMAAITLLENGDFTDGTAHWGLVQSNLPVAATDGRALLGDAALTCHPIPLGEAAVTQMVDLQAAPAGHNITLYFDYEIVTEDKFANNDFDRFVALINGQEKHRDGYRGNDTIGCGKWHTVKQTNFVLDLTSYGGQNISLLLGNTTRYDAWYNTYTYVDNVRVVVTP